MSNDEKTVGGNVSMTKIKRSGWRGIEAEESINLLLN